MSVAVVLQHEAYQSLLNSLMSAAHEAMALNDPAAFQIALCEALIFPAGAMECGAPWPSDDEAKKIPKF